MKKNTIKIISVLVAGLGMSTMASAQWAVTNINDTVNQLINKAGFSSLNNQAGATNLLLQQQAVQQIKNQEDTQKRQLFNGQMTNLENKTGANVPAQPSLQMCIALSQNKDKQSSVQSAGGGGGSSTHPDNKLTKANDDLGKNDADTTKNKSALQTCTPNDAGAGGCSGKDTYGAYAAGDYHPRGMDGQIDGSIKPNTTGPMYKSYTIDAKQWPIATQNVANQTMYANPISLTEEEMKANPSYNATATIIRAKLSAASEALMSQLRLKQASAKPIQGTAKSFWDGGADYTDLTGLKGPAPTNPSLYDVLNYSVAKNFLGKDTDSLDIEELNKRVALQTYIQWQIFKQNEQLIRLNANMLTQMVAPVEPSQAAKEAQTAKQRVGVKK